ncbi:17-beta-hydroxysteroid dehydrogenase 13-like [Limulus polyphemus]|uniref:17-beta-hydroxysteroid dehydrogenase 13-like n=1 Tax=Limulus polyphemus TaxID=6850 RepID=A0ABM1B320_LIMPO|nr:17-beta-hydroxysteroid dehydrogenase 13-like [Limulus polyphemus]
MFFAIVQLVLELLVLYGKAFFMILEGIFRLIFPVSEKSVKDEVVLITGAGHGIGRELALQFAKKQAILVLWDINENEIQNVAEEVRKLGGVAHIYKCDVSDLHQVESIAARIQQEVGDVSILFNNAGVVNLKPFNELEPAEIQRTLSVNTLAHFWTLRQFLPRMIELGRGHVVAMSSVCGILGGPYTTDYSASKHAVIGLMKALEEELHFIGKGDIIHFTAICPTIVDTGFVHHPHTRFPEILPILHPKKVAREAVNAVLTNKRIAVVPSWLGYLIPIFRLFPDKVFIMFQRFLDQAANPNDSLRAKVH